MSDLVNRLRGKYRIPITDGLGAAGGEEPENDNEFVRSFPSTPIQMEAADEIERLRVALDPFAFALKAARQRLGEHPDINDVTALACRFISYEHLKTALSEVAQREAD